MSPPLKLHLYVFIIIENIQCSDEEISSMPQRENETKLGISCFITAIYSWQSVTVAFHITSGEAECADGIETLYNQKQNSLY